MNKRYYICWSSWFDTHEYNVEHIKKVLKVMGCKNIRTSYQFGWSNQPKVVTFTSEHDPIFCIWIAKEKDW